MGRSNGILSGKDSSNNSGFKGIYVNGGSNISGKDLPFTKYYDTYRYSERDVDFTRYIYGDATGELGPFGNKQYGTSIRKISSWYDDEAGIISAFYPWVVRGGMNDYGTNAGLFAFARHVGSVATHVSFRIILAV